MGNNDENNISDEKIITLVTNRLRERKKKTKELEFMFSEVEVMNKKLLQSEESKSHFLSLIRNEFNNPLFGIVPIIENLLGKYQKNKADAEDIESLQMIYTEIGRTNFQLSNIISAAEIENEVLERNITEFDLGALVNDVLKALGYIYSGHNIIFNLDSNVSVLSNDRDKIYVVINNILDNAYKFSGDNNQINMQIFIENDFLHIITINHGPKIDKEKITESFYEDEVNIASREKRGLGLGTSIIQTYVEFLGGNIQIERENENNRIEIKLPVYNNSSDDIFGDELDDFDFDFGGEEEGGVF